MTLKKTSSKPLIRAKSVRLKKARGRKISSQKWLQRQLNDPYVQQAHELNYRSRAAFKLLQLSEKYKFLKPGMTIVDLGAAPGGWAQITLELLKGRSKIIGIDLLEIDPLEGAVFLKGDLTDASMQEQLRTLTPEGVDVVLSDMAASTTGHSQVDHLRTRLLAESAFSFAKSVLKPGGSFVCKVFEGGTHKELLDQLKSHFQDIKHMKPPASRKESPEMYVVALHFRP